MTLRERYRVARSHHSPLGNLWIALNLIIGAALVIGIGGYLLWAILLRH